MAIIISTLDWTKTNVGIGFIMNNFIKWRKAHVVDQGYYSYWRAVEDVTKVSPAIDRCSIQVSRAPNAQFISITNKISWCVSHVVRLHTTHMLPLDLHCVRLKWYRILLPRAYSHILL
jgi:hypothetical protein